MPIPPVAATVEEVRKLHNETPKGVTHGGLPPCRCPICRPDLVR